MGMLTQAFSGALGGFAQGYGEGLKEEMKSASTQRLEAARMAHDEHLAELRNTSDNARLDKTQTFEKEQAALKAGSDLSGMVDINTHEPITVADAANREPSTMMATTDYVTAAQKAKNDAEILHLKQQGASAEAQQGLIAKQMAKLDKDQADEAEVGKKLDLAQQEYFSALASKDLDKIEVAKEKLTVTAKGLPAAGGASDQLKAYSALLKDPDATEEQKTVARSGILSIGGKSVDSSPIAGLTLAGKKAKQVEDTPKAGKEVSPEVLEIKELYDNLAWLGAPDLKSKVGSVLQRAQRGEDISSYQSWLNEAKDAIEKRTEQN